MEIKTRFLILMLLSVQALAAQQMEQDSTKCVQLINSAELDPLNAPDFLRQAEPFAKSPYLIQLLNKEWSYYYQGKREFDSALIAIDRNLTDVFLKDTSWLVQKEVANSYAIKRSAMVGLGRFKDGLDVLFKQLEILDKYKIHNSNHGGVLVDIGIDYWRLEQYQASLEWLERAETFGKKYQLDRALMRVYIMKGLVYKTINQLALAEEYYKHVFELIGEDIEQHVRNYIASCNNMGLVYQQLGNYDSARVYYEKGLVWVNSEKLDKSLEYLIPYYNATFRTNLGIVHYFIEEYSVAKTYFEAAVETIHKNYGESHPFQTESQQALGEIYIIEKDFEKGRNQIDQLIRLYELNGMNTGRGYNLMGELYTAWDDHDELAITYYDSAMLVNTEVTVGETALSKYPEVYLWSLLGKCRNLLGQKEFQFEEVEELYHKTTATLRQINKLSTGLTVSDDVQYILGSFYNAYDSLTEDQSLRALTNQRKWEIIQLNRATKLRSQLQDKYLLTYSLPEHVLAQEQQLRDSLDMKISQLEPGESDSSLFELNRRYDEFISEIELEYPRYATLKNVDQLMPLERRLNKLKKGEAILTFFEGDSSVHLMKITQKGISSKRINKTDVYKQITAFNEAVLDHSLDELISLSDSLRESLMLSHSDLEGIDHLFLAPDGDVWKLDFGSLSAGEYGEGLFLSQQLTFSYDLLLGEFDPIQDLGSEEVVAFSYAGLDEVTPPTGSILFRDLDSDLPGTSEEVKAISEIWQGRYYYSNLATETVFKNEANRSNASTILHLALHGHQDDIFPENSFLKFATEDSLNDGRLHSYELYNLRLKAPLAVLSACNSGSGKVEAGEGMVSLGRAFAYAGVQSILATRWKVPDHTAPVIMEYFYEGLKDGMKKSEALQYAQAQYLENASNVEKAPFFWAGYYILGNDEPIVNTGISRHWVALLGLLLVIAGYFTLRRKG